MSLKDDLIAAKALIDTPEKWCKGDWHRVGRYGLRRCSLGAALAVTGHFDTRFYELERALNCAVPDDYNNTDCDNRIAAYNDRRRTTHPDIMALFDRAIEAATP